ncbi:hypothetical protein L6452_17884 [Arctium lappa]|uniref:Uncharacterized protein n=1 Tax=Arctium lappa TaxID=4217 RepID=A0ACB9C4L5_ARCLA|nr:hypothetical protein L6452_17884 [Arctium lappa]
MLQHEAIFKNQVSELHRLYRRQRDMMEEVKRREFHKYQISIDTSSSSSLMPSQKPYEDAHKWQIPSFPLGISTSARPSIFGAEISNSPLSCSKGNGSKDCELSECRPSKVRKKLFDLQLPAHEYIEPEEGEQMVDNQASEISSYPTKENCFLPKNGVKRFLDDGGKKDGYKDGQHFMGSNGLADLNEPVYIQEATALPPVDFFGASVKPAAFNHLPFEGKGNGRDGFSSCMHEPGNSRSNMNYTSQCFEPRKLQIPSDTMQRFHGKEVQRRATYSEISSQIQDHSHFNQTPLLFGASSGYPYVNTSDIGNSWTPLGPSWGKPNDISTRKLTSFQTHPSFLSSPRSHDVFGDKWHRNGGYGTNMGSGSDLPSCNGFHHGSSSGSKELSARLPSVGFDYRNCNKINGGSQKIFKGSNFVDLTDTTKGMDLNTVQSLSNEDDDESRKTDQTVLPWLRAKTVDAPKEKDDSLAATDRKLLGFPIFGNVCISKNDASSAISTSASMEHRGIDINVAWDDGTASEDIDKRIDVETCNERREETDAEIKNFKNHFDLNSCVTEDDDDLLVTESSRSSKKKMRMEIDLEAPAVSEIEEETETEQTPDDSESEELAKIAAEAIIEISSQKDHPGSADNGAKNDDDPLLWFVEVINSCEKNAREMDEYEMMALQLEDTKEEDYMPVPLVPEDFQEPDDVGPALTSRPRRGQARRGRPRRDFQRDILPGMASLLRHEITEDLQVFGGLMKATGHSWNLGSTRKNGKKLRGRRKVKAVETTPTTSPPPPPPPPPPPSSSKQVNNIEVVGWGKTTRRPRRQRCAAGNSFAVPLT